jgi:hypothetical protein
MHVRLSGEEVVLHPLSYREARRLLAGLPRMRWDLALSSTTNGHSTIRPAKSLRLADGHRRPVTGFELRHRDLL